MGSSIPFGVCSPCFDGCHYTPDDVEYNNRSSGRQTVGDVTKLLSIVPNNC
nr:MAG TPA: hypothetical protein [Caudoviricetes sp.]